MEGSITWPVRECFGMQLDGLYPTVGQRSHGFATGFDLDCGVVGARFFWRDSETAMVGLETGYVFIEMMDSWELGIEAERCFEWLTLGGKMGVASIDFNSASRPIETDKDAFFCELYQAEMHEKIVKSAAQFNGGAGGRRGLRLHRGPARRGRSRHRFWKRLQFVFP